MKRKADWTFPTGAMLVIAIIATLILVPGAMAENGDAALVNINTADTEKLASLPGIGTSKANAIIEHRLEHGPFNTIDGLTNVRGIGINVFEKIRDLIRIQ